MESSKGNCEQGKWLCVRKTFGFYVGIFSIRTERTCFVIVAQKCFCYWRKNGSISISVSYLLLASSDSICTQKQTMFLLNFTVLTF